MDLICSMCTKPYPDIILQVLAVPDLLNFPKGYRMLSQGNFCFGYFPKFLYSLGPPSTIPFLLSWFCSAWWLLLSWGNMYFTYPFPLFQSHWSMITFQVPISLKLKLSSSFRNSVLKNEEYSSRSWKRSSRPPNMFSWLSAYCTGWLATITFRQTNTGGITTAGVSQLSSLHRLWLPRQLHHDCCWGVHWPYPRNEAWHIYHGKFFKL